MPNPRKRAYPMTPKETVLVTQAVANNPAMSKAEVAALATAMQRTPKTIQKAIDKARGAFMGSAEEFVELHKKAVRDAVTAGPDARGFSEALRSLQWAIEKMADGRTRIVEKDDAGSGGTKILIGVKVGGQAADAE